MIMEMDKWLRYYAALAREKFPKANLNEPGTGAAGGLGFAFLTFTKQSLSLGSKSFWKKQNWNPMSKERMLL